SDFREALKIRAGRPLRGVRSNTRSVASAVPPTTGLDGSRRGPGITTARSSKSEGKETHAGTCASLPWPEKTAGRFSTPWVMPTAKKRKSGGRPKKFRERRRSVGAAGPGHERDGQLDRVAACAIGR